MLLERGVVGLRGGNVGFEQHPSVDGQPASVEGLYLVGYCDVGVQIRVAGPAVAVGERGADEASHVDLPDALRPRPGEQSMVLDEHQGVLDCGLMGLLDHRRHRRIGDRPQTRHRLHRGECQVIPGNSLCPRPRVFRDLSRQFPGIHRLPAMLGEEELPGHLGPYPGPVRGRQRCVRGKAGSAVDCGNAPGDLEPERADVAIEDLERRAQLGHFLEVADGECWPFKLLLAELGQRMHAAAEQRSHLLGGHRVADGQAVDPVQAGADPDAWGLTTLGVVRRQPGVPFFGCVQRCDLAGQVVIT